MDNEEYLDIKEGLSVGTMKIANKYEIFTEEEIDAINNKIPELNERVGVIEDEIEGINSSLDNMENKKLDKNGILSMANMGQDIKEAMTGGSVAVVGKNAILEENIVDGQVTRKKLTCYKLSTKGNLLSRDFNTSQLGYMYDNKGNKLNGSYWTLKLTLEDIDFINTPLKFNFTSYITYWDENDTFISGYIQGSLDNGVNTEYLKNIPSNAKYVRMMIYNSRFSDAVISINKYYKPNLKTSYYIPQLIVENENIDNKQNVNPLYEKKAIFFGDSWCAGNTSAPSGWAGIIKNNNPTMTITNCGIHGADWSQCYTHFINKEEVWNSLDDNADYIIIEAYTNGLYSDVSSISKPLGEIDEFNFYNSHEEIEKAHGNTYAKDLEIALYHITKRWQGKKIGVIFPYKSVAMLRENNAFRVFREQVFKCCRKYNIPIFDNFDSSNIQSHRQEFVDKYFFEKDGCHLNKLGYEIITPPIESWIKTL